MDRRIVFAAAALILALPISSDASWTCEETASLREGRVLTSCGIGVGQSEDEARRSALRNAKDELLSVCELSHDCASFHLNVTPLRTECRRTSEGYHCTRGLRAVITDKPKPGWREASRGGSSRERFGDDLREFERLHEITRKLSRDMSAWMTDGEGAPPAQPEIAVF